MRPRPHARSICISRSHFFFASGLAQADDATRTARSSKQLEHISNQIGVPAIQQVKNFKMNEGSNETCSLKLRFTTKVLRKSALGHKCPYNSGFTSCSHLIARPSQHAVCDGQRIQRVTHVAKIFPSLVRQYCMYKNIIKLFNVF